MTDRILAAMDYHLDAQTKAVSKQLKQRMLGDIDSKYSLVDPLLEISYYPSNKKPRASEGTDNDKAIQQPLAGTIFRGIEQDLERLVRSPERTRSSTAPVKSSRMTISNRPFTSSSRTTVGSNGTREEVRHFQNSLFGTNSQASIKSLAFTSPSVKIGIADVRDEVMDEIVNKPLVFHRSNIKSQSAPPSGRMTSSGIKSAGTRSTKRLISPKRARTSYSRRRRIGDKSREKNSSPFMTVKVSGRDLWVVSNSTPTTYFIDKLDECVSDPNSNTGAKIPSWENTANSVPKAEQSSPPRHERLLAPPAQFAPTVQWLRYDHSEPPKKPPVLTPFKDTTDGRYYHLESHQCKKVSQHMNASPGVRIARNGEVLSHSMKLESMEGSDHESDKESESESDVDVASLLPAKLSAKMKKLYGTPENDYAGEDNEEDDEGDDEDEENDDEDKNSEEDEGPDIFPEENGVVEDTNEVVVEDNGSYSEEDDANDDAGNESENQSERDSDHSSMSEADSMDDEDEHPEPAVLTKEKVELLAKLTSHSQSNPLVESSDQTSATSWESHELEDYLESRGIKFDSPRIYDDADEDSDVWKILENVNPTFWITRSRHQKLAILRRLKKQGEVERIAESTRESLKSAKTKEEVTEVIVPLCWEDELNRANKVVEVREGSPNIVQKNSSSALPVVFHKGSRKEVLPTATITSTMKKPVTKMNGRPRSAVSQRVSFGIKTSRGYTAPVSTPRSNRSIGTKSLGSRQSSASSIRGTGSATQSLVNGTEIVRRSMDLADLLRVTPDSLPSKPQVTTFSHSVKKERVTIVHENTTAATENGDNVQNQTAKTFDAPHTTGNGITNQKETIGQPMATLDFTGLDVDTTNDSMTYSSQRPSDLKSCTYATPQNTPKITSMHPHSTYLTPKYSGRTATTDTPRLKDKSEEELDYRESDPHPLRSKPMSMFSNEEQNGSGNRLPSAQNRRVLTSVPISQNRLRSGSSRAASSHYGASGSRPIKALPDKYNGLPQNGVTDNSLSVPPIQLGVQSLASASSAKSADFIQITQSLRISDRSNTEGERIGLTGNKMYDSYMRELAVTVSEQMEDERNSKGIVGRGLGGTSGKVGSFPLPRSVKKNLASYQQTPHHQPPNISPFTPQAGRRSGLTMVPQDNSKKIGPFGLGVKGDQVRLNIDKNIHNIYRDLGVLKSNNADSKNNSTGSPGRSHLSSAKSATTHKDDIVISIPSVPPSERNNAVDNEDTEIHDVNKDDKMGEVTVATRPSSSDPSVSVQDSGTQWSSRSVKFDNDTDRQAVQPNMESQDTVEPEFSPTQDQLQPKSEPQHDKKETEITTRPSSPAAIANEAHTNGNSSSQSPNSMPLQTSKSPVAAKDENIPNGNENQINSVVERSASETLLDRLAEMGEKEEDNEDTDEELDENGNASMKGVTRVTVNISTSPEHKYNDSPTPTS